MQTWVGFQNTPTSVMGNRISIGPLTGGPQCRMSNLINPHVPCHFCCCFHVHLKIVPCRMLILRNGHVAVSNLRVKGPSIMIIMLMLLPRPHYHIIMIRRLSFPQHTYMAMLGTKQSSISFLLTAHAGKIIRNHEV